MLYNFLSFCIGDSRSVSIDGAEVSATVDDDKEKLSTKKPAMLNLPEEMTVMQIDCGTFHTGEGGHLVCC